MLTLTLVILSSGLFGQSRFRMDTITNKITYDSTIVCELSKAELYRNIRMWVATAFNNGKYVTQIDDSTQGLFFIKGSFHSVMKGFLTEFQPAGYTDFTFTVHFKDNKVKYRMTDFYNESDIYGYSGGPVEELMKLKNGYAESLCNDIKKTKNRFLKSFVEKVPTTQSSSDDW